MESEFLAATGANRATLKAAISRHEAAFAFGTERLLAGGSFLDLDVVAWALTDEMTPAFGRKTSSAIVRTFSDKWCDGVARADHGAPTPIYLIVAESGEKLEGTKMRALYSGVNVDAADLAEFSKGTLTAKRFPERLTLINLTALLARLRGRGTKIGLDLSAPFCPHPDDPEFKRVRRETRQSREDLVPRLSARD